MGWLQVILAVTQALSRLVSLLQARQLMAAGEAKAIADALEVTSGQIKIAQAARLRARNSDPDPRDPYLRD